MVTVAGFRELPAPAAMRTTCPCGAEIVWAITVAGPSGRGGKAIPLDALEDLAGNVAVTQVDDGDEHGFSLSGRWSDTLDLRPAGPRPAPVGRTRMRW